MHANVCASQPAIYSFGSGLPSATYSALTPKRASAGYHAYSHYVNHINACMVLYLFSFNSNLTIPPNTIAPPHSGYICLTHSSDFYVLSPATLRFSRVARPLYFYRVAIAPCKNIAVWPRETSYLHIWRTIGGHCGFYIH